MVRWAKVVPKGFSFFHLCGSPLPQSENWLLYGFLRHGCISPDTSVFHVSCTHQVIPKRYPVDFVTKAVSFFALMKMTAILLVAVIFYAMRLPERFFPGTFDIFGHSHQIWHILIFISVLALLLRLTIQIYVNYLGVIDSHAFWKLENPQCRIPISQML